MPALVAPHIRHSTPCAAARRVDVIVWLLLVLWLGAADALPLADPARDAERERFVQAEQALARGDMTSYRTLGDGLRSYPLYSYLLFDALERRLATASDVEIAALVEEHAGSPRAEQLRRRWLERAAERRQWGLMIDAWRPQRSTDLKCEYARALYETGRDGEARELTRELWLVGRSQPDACDSAFRRWRDGGNLDPALVWERTALAVRSGERRLARYLARQLPADDATLVELWLEVVSNPSQVLDSARFRPDTPHRRQIRLDGLGRLARRDPSRAEQAWRSMQAEHRWSDAQRVTALRVVGLGYAQEHMDEGSEFLAEIPDREADKQVWEWRALLRLRARDWAGLRTTIERMPSALSSSEMWRYWLARATEQLGDRSRSTDLYRSLAGTRSFHGFLAADRLGADYDFTPDLLRFDASELEATATIPGIARTRELLALGRELDARREWYTALDGLQNEQLLLAARLAQLWGWHAQAIFTVARADHFDDIELRFPLVYTDEFNDNAVAQGLEPAWVLAVARQESAFVMDARSPAGALGLMQIMPTTGRSIARTLKVPYNDSRTLLDPTTSIRFGAHYLRRLLDRFGGHPALATAAYNAGPSRAERWRPADADLDADIWIDTVPYAETRRYVQRVLYYTVIYQHRLGVPVQRLNPRLAPVQARHPQASL